MILIATGSLRATIIMKAFIQLNIYDNYKYTFYKDIIWDEWGTACSTRAFLGFPLRMMKLKERKENA